MRNLLKDVVIQSLCLYIVSLILPGLKIYNIDSLFLGGFLLVLGYKIFSPIFQIILLPFNLISLGLFSAVTTLVSLFIITGFVKSIQIHAFVFPGISFYFLNIKSFHLTLFLSFIAISVTIYVLGKLMNWVFEAK